ncbi:uncharacterized protein LOC119481886 isoform X2 [Sebastes umbrosus]|uniref:uncharacterized protein LOC119481886 isoform X2 n=1 Tax=Sebastes umbrosus TaxID=72105 RepID=UPI0018A0A4C3|nr:uncharacterized protein LOC119481886 isoform X2 [Sebastes umbrosus]
MKLHLAITTHHLLLYQQAVGVAAGPLTGADVVDGSIYTPADFLHRYPSASPKRKKQRNIINSNRTCRLYIHLPFLISIGGKHKNESDCDSGYLRIEVGSMLSSRRSDTTQDARKTNVVLCYSQPGTFESTPDCYSTAAQESPPETAHLIVWSCKTEETQG